MGLAAASLMGSVPALAAEEEMVSYTPDEVLDVDVLVCGCGVSGIMAAAAAGRAGANVLAVDAAESVVMTNMCAIAGSFGIEDRDQVQQDEYITKEEFFNYIYEGTHYQSNAGLLSHMLDVSASVWDIMYDAGVSIMQEFMGTNAESTVLARTGHVYTVRGEERAVEFEKLLADNHVKNMWETSVKDLIVEDGVVTGAYAEAADGKIYQINAKGGVVVACGGFLHNEEMVKQYFAGTQMTQTHGNKLTDGAGIKMVQKVGGQLGKNFSISLNETTAGQRKSVGENCLLVFPLLGNLLVNKYGKRFMNEQAQCERTMFCGEPLIREGGKYYAVTDQAFIDTLTTTALGEFLGEAAVANMAPTLRMTMVNRVMEELPEDVEYAIEEGWCWKADTLEELQEMTGMPHLKDTIEMYNGFCETGVDTQMYKPAMYMRPIAEGPFYVIECEIAAWMTIGGIKTDEDCRVMTADMDPIEGLYVAGADCDCWATPYYQGGTTSGFALSSGYIAGEAAAKRANA